MRTAQLKPKESLNGAPAGSGYENESDQDEPKNGEMVRYWHNSNDAQLAVIAGFTGNATDVIIRLADGAEIVAPCSHESRPREACVSTLRKVGKIFGNRQPKTSFTPTQSSPEAST
jgi:hypothetical protein